MWAPRAERAELVVAGRRAALTPVERGWFTATAPAVDGDDYGFRLDGGPLRPDPASRRQPTGVHGLSRLVDPRRFAWSPAEAGWRGAPLAGAVVYELHVGTFTPARTFDAVAEHLPELADLGVTHVEVMPVNTFNGTHGWGYDGVGWYAVHEPYGGPAAFARLVDACHRAGLSVVLDVVYNHLGPSGNYLPDFGPYLTDRYATPWGPALNLDGPGSDPVRAFVVDNALMWLADYHVDALRLDAVHGLIDTSALPILTELSAAVEALAVRSCRPLQIMAESDRCDPLTVRPRALGGTGLDGQWADDLHHAVHSALTGERDGYYVDYRGLRDVAETYRRGFLFDGRYSVYRQRTVGAPLGDTPGHRLVGCVQNHDQVGNRAFGERLTALVDPALARIAALLLCAAPHTPLLFMGEEYGETNPFLYFTSHPEPELAEAVRAGRRDEFARFAAFAADVPDPQDPATLGRSTLERSRARTPEGRARRALWADLLMLRRQQPALANGRRDLVEVLAAGDETLLLARRDPTSPPLLVAANLGDAVVALPAPAGDGWAPLLDTGHARSGGAGAAARHDPAGRALRVGPRSAVLWTGRY
ncbi:MAG TPA: malto-oligosyltrehalose trehalohydrolase [Egibacteraceae bacterium]|nr:malto-oligosyltrehalose trehalohydrolase [Egibacteraceae bacterium]